jgi:hypothetical protein
MVSIVSSYPGFHALPRGIKQLLLTSETHFFNEATATTTLHSTPAVPAPPALIPLSPEMSGVIWDDATDTPWLPPATPVPKQIDPRI